MGTSMTVLLSTIDRPTRSVACQTYEQASQAVRAFIEQHAFGASEWTGGQVMDEFGNQVARVSYNGRVWAPTGQAVA